MKLTCTQENFKRSVHNTERVTGKQNTLPILNNILLETDKGRLKFSATNLEIGVMARIGAKIEREGKITIPSKILSNFVVNLPAQEKIEIEEKDLNLIIKSGNYQARIKGLDAQDFPIIPKMGNGPMISVSAHRFKELVGRLLVCVAFVETRPELTGINVIFSEKDIQLAATDSFRLAEGKLPVEISPEADQTYQAFLSKVESVIIPAVTLTEVLRIIGPETSEIKISFEENQIFFDIDGVQVVSRLINGKYPEYKQIIPDKFSTRVVVAKEDFLRSIKASSVFTSSQSAGEIKIIAESDKKTLTITSQSQETGENKTKLPVDITGPSQEIVFNPRYIYDGAHSLSSDQIAFLMINDSSPAAFRAIDPNDGTVADNFVYIVMPVKN